ncbi:hypothetical protein [Paenibacillus ihumii]|nr:hypothetical protein [Paenibacillus ihumii]
MSVGMGMGMGMGMGFGFNNRNTFIRAFKGKEGITPANIEKI